MRGSGGPITYAAHDAAHRSARRRRALARGILASALLGWLAVSAGRLGGGGAAAWGAEPIAGAAQRGAEAARRQGNDGDDGGPIVVAGGAFNRDLYALDPGDGAAPTGARLTDTPGVSEGEPSWGPGRGSVAYAAPRDEPPLAADAAIWRLDTVSGLSIALSTGPHDRDPDWSPDGAEVVFASVLERGRESQVSTLAAAAADGRAQRLLIEPLVAPDAVLAGPRWSPDGRAVAFVVVRHGEGELYGLDLGAGVAERWLARPGWDDVEPAWSPDGRLVAFASGYRAPGALTVEHGLWLFEPATGRAGRLLAVPGVDLRRPAWSPSGTRLAYAAAARGEAALVHATDLYAPAHRLPLWTTPADALDWTAPAGGAPTATDEPPTPTAGASPTDGPTPDATPTQPTLPTLAPLPAFPTLPPPEPTLPSDAPPFPLPSPTPSAGPSPSPTRATSPEPTAAAPAARVFLPIALGDAGIAAP